MDIFQQISIAVASAVTSIFAVGSMDVLQQPSPTPAVASNPNVVTRTGQYDYAGESLRYTIHIPKSGGPVTGNLEGQCSGPISGTYNGKEGGQLVGEVNAVCSFAFIKKDLSIDYSGNLFLKAGRADLNWEGQIPLTSNQGNITLNFEPAN